MSKAKPEFNYTEMQKMVCDLKYAKKLGNKLIDKDSISRFGLIDGTWQQIPKNVYRMKAFKEFVWSNFEDVPTDVEDQGNTHFFMRKTNASD